MNIIQENSFKFQTAIEHFREELRSMRSGRAHAGLVENTKVECYGTQSILQQVANISVPDARSIVIQPWDKSIIKDIEKALQNSNLSLSVVNEGNIIRVPIPSLTEERRLELVRLIKEKAEQSRIVIRNIREDVWKNIKDQKTAGKITEDAMFLLQKELQKEIDQYNESIKEIVGLKEKEVMTI